MSVLNLHNRQPNELPDKLTIDDILLELKDTDNFDIEWVSLVSDPYQRGGWSAHNRTFHEWVEQGVVVVNEIVNQRVEQEDIFKTMSVSFKEIRYNILRQPVRLHIKSKLPLGYSDDIEKIEMCKDVYLRIKDYLGPDVIQDQYNVNHFMMDFMISSVRMIN
jgi:hypothetical protein